MDLKCAVSKLPASRSEARISHVVPSGRAPRNCVNSSKDEIDVVIVIVCLFHSAPVRAATCTGGQLLATSDLDSTARLGGKRFEVTDKCCAHPSGEVQS